MTDVKPLTGSPTKTAPTRSVQEKLLLPMLFALILLNLTAAIIAAGSLRSYSRSRTAARQAIYTNAQLSDIYSNLRDAESGQRGYIITGDDSYLAPYYTGVKEAKQNLSELQTQLRDTTSQQKITQLNSLTAAKLAELSDTITLRQTQGIDAAVAVVKTNQGKATMDTIRTLLNTMKQQATATTAMRDHRSNQFAAVAYSSLAVSFICTLGLVYFVLLIFKQLQLHRKTLEDTNTELERSNRELQDFASIASHDLQEPLRKIQAFGDRLQTSTELSDDSQVYLDRMLNAAGRMRILIDDLLSYSRVTTKAQPFKRVSLRRVVKEVLTDMEVRIEETNARIDVRKLPAIQADALQMRQLFQNLLSNALKFRKEDVPPHIKVYATMESSGGRNVTVISVSDNGIGFDQKYADRIFTIFQRLHGRNEYEGTGIGLAVVRKIVERHGGSIEAISSVGTGTQFIITLPITHDSARKKGETP